MKQKSSLLLIIFITLILAGCASREVTKEKEAKKEFKPEIPVPPKVLNFDMKERVYAKTNRIKSIDKVRFDYDRSGKLVPKGKVSTINYDVNGFLTGTIIYSKNSDIEDSYTYKYDDKGVRTETYRSEVSGGLKNKYTYEYDKTGNKIKSVRFDLHDKIEKYYLYKYDSNNNLLEDDWFDKSGKPEYRIVNKYSPDSRKEVSFTYGGNENLISSYKYKYDYKGNIVEEAQFDEKGKPVGIIQYVYIYY